MREWKQWSVTQRRVTVITIAIFALAFLYSFAYTIYMAYVVFIPKLVDSCERYITSDTAIRIESYQSNDFPHVYRVTHDGGKNWEKFLEIGNDSGLVEPDCEHSITVIDDVTFSISFLGYYNGEAISGWGRYTATTTDGGRTWQVSADD